MSVRRLLERRDLNNAADRDDGEQAEASLMPTAAPSGGDTSVAGSPLVAAQRGNRMATTARRAEETMASLHVRFATTRRRSAAEVQEIFDVPFQPLPFEKKLGAGAFGTVFRSHTPSGCVVAIKRVVEDKSHVNREAEVCKMLAEGNHPNIIEVKGIYFTEDQQGERAMNLVLEYVSKSMQTVLLFLSKRKMRMKPLHVKMYMFQLARALLFLHQNDILHRDLKPDNILINPEMHELKLADFGSAKKIVPGRTNVTYICSRFYRAPELILDRDLYSPAIDIWAYGCILAEVAVGCPFFIGEDNVSQLVEIMKVLGTITPTDVDSMAASPGNELGAFCFPPRGCKPWPQALTVKLSSGRMAQTSFGGIYESLLNRLIQWRPSRRLSAQQILAHPFFDELKASSGQCEALPLKLFMYTDEELAVITHSL